MRLPAPLLLVTNRRLASCPLYGVVAGALEGGCRWVMIREKELTATGLTVLVLEMLPLIRRYDAILTINGNPALAALCDVPSVHLSFRDQKRASVAEARRLLGHRALIGVSTHSLDEAQRAARAGADYVTLSPIYLTESKPCYDPALGLDKLREVADVVPIPVIALGGLTPANALGCLRAGAEGIAVMGPIMRAASPAQAVQDFIQACSAIGSPAV